MRFDPNDYLVIQPKNLKEVLKLKNEYREQISPLAGGTDVMVLLNAGHLQNKKWINIWGITELGFIRNSGENIEIGALTTYDKIQEHKEVKKYFPNLVSAAKETGARAIQNRGTIGGNIANASPAADTPPALLSYDAQIKLLSIQGERVVPYANFHTGYKTTVMRTDEIIGSVIIPKTSSTCLHYYRKVGTRRAQAISKVCVCIVAKKGKSKTELGPEFVLDDIKISFGSVAPFPVRAITVENAIKGRRLTETTVKIALEEILTDISPISDIRSTRDYRIAVAKNLISDFVSEVIKGNL